MNPSGGPGLTTSQVLSGPRRIKVTRATAYCTRTRTREKNAYLLSADPVDWAIYVKAEVGVTLT